MFTRNNLKVTLPVGLVSLISLSIIASPAQAALITGVTASTNMGTLDSRFDLDATVNGQGLVGNIPALTGTHAAWSESPPNTWVGTQATGSITFDLNGSRNLGGFSFWNYNGSIALGIRNVTIEGSTDGINFTPIVGAPTQFAQAPVAFEPVDPEQFSFSPVEVSFVRFTIADNYGAGRTGFAEVQFQELPEPSTLLGLGGLGLSMFSGKVVRYIKNRKNDNDNDDKQQ